MKYQNTIKKKHSLLCGKKPENNHEHSYILNKEKIRNCLYECECKASLTRRLCAKELVWLLEFSTFEITTTEYDSDKCSSVCISAYDLAQQQQQRQKKTLELARLRFLNSFRKMFVNNIYNTIYLRQTNKRMKQIIAV